MNWMIGITVFLAILGIVVSIWSIMDTRNKYYQDYLNRHGKKNG
jgi:hypothetical protein